MRFCKLGVIVVSVIFACPTGRELARGQVRMAPKYGVAVEGEPLVRASRRDAPAVARELSLN